MSIGRKERQLALSLWDKAQINLNVGDYPLRLDVKQFSVLGSIDFNQYSLYNKGSAEDVKINPFANFLITRNFSKSMFSLGHILNINRNFGLQQRLTAVNKIDVTNIYTHSKLWFAQNGFFVSANFNTLILSKLHKNYYNVSLGWEQDGISIGSKFGSKMQEVGEAPGRLDKYSLNVSKDFGASGAVALQYKRDFKEEQKNGVTVCYQNKINDNLSFKTRLDNDFNIGLFTRYSPANNWVLKSALSSNLLHKYNNPGFLGQPIDFSLNIEYNPY